MNLFSKLRRRLGIDPAQARYAYGKDARYGYVSASSSG
jgi:hypothetical protein